MITTLVLKPQITHDFLEKEWPIEHQLTLFSFKKESSSEQGQLLHNYMLNLLLCNSIVTDDVDGGKDIDFRPMTHGVTRNCLQVCITG